MKKLCLNLLKLKKKWYILKAEDELCKVMPQFQTQKGSNL